VFSLLFSWQYFVSQQRKGKNFVQTTKHMYDLESHDPFNEKRYDETFMMSWAHRIRAELDAADSEYFKFTGDVPTDDFITLPSPGGDGFYYIPEQHRQWMWRRARPTGVCEPKSSTVFHYHLPPGSKYTYYPKCIKKNRRRNDDVSTDSKYLFQNGRIKVLIS
ncbi:hypothetical protein AVEN_212025-1, partial [Araneus ventricosus]